jgi:hypothetical protein
MLSTTSRNSLGEAYFFSKSLSSIAPSLPWHELHLRS